MTTTLRPLEPERHGPRGRRTRRYAVCVNSRPVGAILVGAEERHGALVGELSELSVDQPDRRRGRATVAALAAEEVLRQWGCARVSATVPGESGAGLGLALSLGYTEASRWMAKRLPEAPPLPPGTTARPMTEAEFPAWLAEQNCGYIEDLTGAGAPPEEARARAEAGNRELLPAGARTPHVVLRVLSTGGAPGDSAGRTEEDRAGNAAGGTGGEDVGTLWVGLRGPADPGQAWVYAVAVDEDRRGRGHGRSLMLLAEAECVAAGVRELGLNVFPANTPAVRLYESLGYRVVNRCLVKPLL